MKVLFLAIDGVLNTERYIKACGHYGVVIDPELMENVKRIVDTTGAKIVLTTSWREFWEEKGCSIHENGKEIDLIFARHGLEVYSKTPFLPFLGREAEIRDWLDNRTDIAAYAAVDDMFLSAYFLEGHFVRTSNYIGLTAEYADKVIEILS